MSGEAKQSQTTAAPARRDFLKAMTGAGAAVVGAAAAESAVAQQPAEREDREERTKARYQPNSPDVQAYYRTNRY